MTKHSRLFYRTVARIRAVGEPNGAVLIDRLKTKLKIDYVRAGKLKEELVKAKVLRYWSDEDFKKTVKGKKPKGNIIWKNLSKYKMPKELQIKETAAVKEERRKGLF